MKEEKSYHPGDIVTLKKKHPCGTNEWEILGLGADIRLRCRGCGHCVMIPRTSFNRNAKEVKEKENIKKRLA